MKFQEIRQTFFDFFESKGHKIVDSAPLVNNDDPSLMFINAGMNPFKDFFLGTKKPQYTRVADTQKCLRVSGKHNDLEEVGVDSYHHTMFEMLGNWSFGDYFKEEAIAWAWELLTDVYKIDKERLYVTIFGGEEADKLVIDHEAQELWKTHIPADRILPFGKKDNFWEMGDTGPCGPCSEIHVDLRSEAERKKVDGKEFVNQDHPLVVEIWNLVFIQFNRDQSGSLHTLPAKHIDTGMGFERLCMVLQGKQSNYETDVFSRSIGLLERLVGLDYSNTYDSINRKDIAFRVVVDHLRAVSFAIADGQMPSSTGAGYVIRRILRRAVRYYYSFLSRKEPLIYLLVRPLAEDFQDVFPELLQQIDFVEKIILEEEKSFLQTLSTGLKRFADLKVSDGVISGVDAFELYDTYGFPYDLTTLLAQEKGFTVDEKTFHDQLEIQKNRSRKDAQKTVGDWVVLSEGETSFIGYDHLEAQRVKILRYRQTTNSSKELYELVLDQTPFYPEGGGQIGDRGRLVSSEENIKVLTTRKENDLILHIVDRIPTEPTAFWNAHVDDKRRKKIENNHTATHLLHAALREVLGNHVGQKGSYLDEKGLRFDFTHYQKVEDEELRKVESIVNAKIQEAIPLEEFRDMSLEDAKESGAMMFFGEKYGEKVRMIVFDPKFSKELCGGCHVENTSLLNLFTITSESSVASGVRRVEARTSKRALDFYKEKLEVLEGIEGLFKNSKNLTDQVKSLQSANKELQKQLDTFNTQQVSNLRKSLLDQAQSLPNGVTLIATEVEVPDAKALKSLIFDLEKQLDNAVIVLGSKNNGKAQLMGISSESTVQNYDLKMGDIIKNIASNINGGGGGSPKFASAGGSKPEGLKAALNAAQEIIQNAVKQ